MSDSDFTFICDLVYQNSRIKLGPDKRPLVLARLGKRLRAMGLASVAEYRQALQGAAGADELPHLIDAISTNHTWFFRETPHFEFLRSMAPELAIRARAAGMGELRVWSAACSTGEEPFSIAMTLAEVVPGFPWQIEASDISRRVLERAVTGVYAEERVAGIPRDTLQRHFQRGVGAQEGNFRIKRTLLDRVSFRHLNLLGDLPFRAPFHVIFCRNVMIYFDTPTQAELVHALAAHLVPGGYLLVGHSESLTRVAHPLRPVRPAVYQKSFSS